ncbi:hypothetical protein [Clostridium lundense]|uniref:hypothetical protein n=1 Tax=Clostridium lundense TaxID=319475 RepID=UPI000685841F|nr:hypothetical protein [Clostridium lundense]
MKVKMNKMLITIMIAIFIITPVSVFASTNKKRIEVMFNKTNIKINGVNFNGNRMVYNGTIYLPIKNIARLFNLSIYTYEPTKTIYIGQVPAGEIPRNIKQANKNTKDVLISKELSSIDVVLNSINVKVHGEKIKSDTILYNNEVFVSLQEVCKILGIDFNYYKPTSTIYVGMIPQNEIPYDVYKKWSYNEKKTLDSKPALGEMQGWYKLTGHEYENIADIYYKLDGSVLSVIVKDIRKVDLNKIVEWTNDDGTKMYNRLGDIYTLFSSFSQYSCEWFSEKFGAIYGEWLMVSSIQADNIVLDYLQQTGQMQKQNNVTLTPDAEYEVIESENEEISTEEMIRNIEKYMESQKNK